MTCFLVSQARVFHARFKMRPGKKQKQNTTLKDALYARKSLEALEIIDKFRAINSFNKFQQFMRREKRT